MDAMFYEVFKEEEVLLKQMLPSHIVAQFTAQTIQESKDKNPPSKLISIRTQSRIPLSWMEKLEGILTRSQGYDHLQAFRKATGHDLACGYLTNYCARAVAEQAVTSMMMLMRKVKKQIKQFKTFNRDNLTGKECMSRKVLVVGVGNIGYQIVDLVKGLRMPVKGVDLVHRFKDLQYVPLSDGIRWAEVIFCALPLTDLTENLFEEVLFKQAQKGMVFVNISRAEITPIAVLKKFLDEGILGGLSLDVYPQEDLFANYVRSGKGKLTAQHKDILDLKNRDNVLFTPHNAFNTKEALERKAAQSIESVEMFLKNGKFPNSVPA